MTFFFISTYCREKLSTLYRLRNSFFTALESSPYLYKIDSLSNPLLSEIFIGKLRSFRKIHQKQLR